MKKTRMVALAAPIVALLALSACSSGAAAGLTKATGSQSAVVKASIAQLAKYENPRPQVTVTPLSKKPPTGKTLDIVNCAIPVCQLYTAAAKKAASALGWPTKVITTQFTAESYTATWNSVVQDKPDVVLAAAVFPDSVIRNQLAELQKAGTIILPYAGGTPAGPGSPFLYAGGNLNEQYQQGKVMGLIAIADAKAGPNIMFVNVPSTPSAPPTATALKKTVQAAGGTYNELDLNTPDIGTTGPAAIVSFLQAHPAVKYVGLPWDDWIAGLPQALKSAGLGSIKVIGTAANSTSQKHVKSGLIFRSIVHPTAQNSWYMLDAAARHMVGDKIVNPNPDGPIVVVSPQTNDAIGDAGQWPHIDSQFLKAWKVDQ
jgi:ABC-type sugar transport system substrate-binding protein